MPYIPRSRKVVVKVTSEIIDTATQADSAHCMIADAVRQAVPGARGISVDLQTIRFSDPEKRLRYTYLTPRLAQLALVDFDMGDRPEPFQFRIDKAHITEMRTVRKGPAQEMSPAKAAALAKARETYRPGLASRQGGEHVPERVGGTPPPTGPLAGGKTGRRRKGTPPGLRRSFGLRALDRGSRKIIESTPED